MNDNLHTRLTSETLVKADIKARAEECFDVLAGIDYDTIPNAYLLAWLCDAKQALKKMMRECDTEKPKESA